MWDIVAHLTGPHVLKQLLHVYLRTTGNVHGVRPAYQYGSEQMQSIVAKVVGRRTHINDALERIEDQFHESRLISDEYHPQRASAFLNIPTPYGGIIGGTKIILCSRNK